MKNRLESTSKESASSDCLETALTPDSANAPSLWCSIWDGRVRGRDNSDEKRQRMRCYILPSGEDAEWILCSVGQREERQETEWVSKWEGERVKREFELLISYNYRNIAMSGESPEAYPPSFHLLPSVYRSSFLFPALLFLFPYPRRRTETYDSLVAGTSFRNPISGLFLVKQPIYEANLN